MKIVQISAGAFRSDYGGGQVYLQRLIWEMSRREGVSLHIISQEEAGPAHQEEGYSIHPLPPTATAAELQTLIAEIAPDLLHAHARKADAAQACATLGIPCLITAHHGGILCPAGALRNTKDALCQQAASPRRCLPCVLRQYPAAQWAAPLLNLLPLPLYQGLGRLCRKLPFILWFSPVLQAGCLIRQKQEEWQRICRYADAVLAPSHAMAEALRRNGLPEAKLRLLPHGIPPMPNAAYPAPKAGEPLRFYYAGRICYDKGIHILLQAFSALKGKAELHLFGGAGNKREQRYASALQKRYASDPRIIWHGKVPAEALPEQLAPFPILLHPAIFLESFGLNIGEALAMGKYVLATRCGGAEMQIREGVNGWLVEPNSAPALLHKMQEILLNPPRCAPEVLYHSEAEHCDALLRLYRELIQGHEKAPH